MKHFNLLILLLFAHNTIFSQIIGKVDYYFTLNLGIEYQTSGVLTFNNEQSQFIELSPYQSSKIDSEPNEIRIGFNPKDRPIIITNLKKDSLYSQEFLFEKKYITAEKIPDINWEITDETKQIENLTCQKANGTFRGRDYTVWFTKEVPVSYGHWKLQGLPGLILEAYDTNKEIIFQIKSVKIGSSISSNFAKLTQPSISLKHFVDMKDGVYKEKEKQIATKMPRSASVSIDMPERETQMEIIYEWENK